MKFITIATGLAGIAFTLTNAVDVTYSVVAFPGSGESVSVNVGQKDYPLQKSPKSSNVFTGTAPFGKEYRYKVGQKAENSTRYLSENTTTTGNQFFGRSRTVYNIPAIKRSFNPIYPAFESPMNRDNEISTIILNADMKAVDKFIKNPKDYNNDWAQIYNMSYISHDAIYTFEGAGIKNSGQSSRGMAKQSLKIKFNKFNNSTKKDRLFNRIALKFRAQANDPSMAREKLMMDTLAATGAATLDSTWVRIFINSEPFGLFLMSDDSFKGYTDNFLNGGSAMKSTGVTIKANAMDPENESNMVYNGTDPKNYNFRNVYMLEEEGKGKTINETNYMYPLIEFMEKLNKTVPGSAKTPGNINEIIDSPEQTMIQIAMSFLSGSWDGLWRQASNFYFHQNKDTKKWYVISYDFDETFGNGLQKDLKLMTTPYKEYARPGSRRPLIDAFVKDPYYQPKFEEILKTIVKRTFNPRVLKPRLEAWSEMLKEDIAWDRSLPFRSPGDKENFTVADLSNMFTTVGSRVGVLEWVSNRTTSLCKQLNFTDADDLPALPTYEKKVPTPTA